MGTTQHARKRLIDKHGEAAVLELEAAFGVEPPRWKEFDPLDWQAWMGAEKFENDDEPLIAYVKVEGRDATLILDSRGVYLWMEDDTEGNASENRNDAWAVRFAATLKAEYTFDELEHAGFAIDRPNSEQSLGGLSEREG